MKSFLLSAACAAALLGLPQAASAADIDPAKIADHVKVLLREAPRESWGIGGVAASAISLGYEVEV